MTQAKGRPQLEDGHTRIANELLEAILRYPFGAGELKTVLAIIRLTYGWQTKARPIKQRTLVSMTGLHERHIQRVLIGLRQQGVLFCHRATRPYTYQLNKAYRGWRDWPEGRLPDNLAALHTTSCELSGESDNLVRAAPDTGVSPLKEIKKEEKESARAPDVGNLSQYFERALKRPLTQEEVRLLIHLQELSPSQAAQLLAQVTHV